MPGYSFLYFFIIGVKQLLFAIFLILTGKDMKNGCHEGN